MSLLLIYLLLNAFIVFEQSSSSTSSPLSTSTGYININGLGIPLGVCINGKEDGLSTSYKYTCNSHGDSVLYSEWSNTPECIGSAASIITFATAGSGTFVFDCNSMINYWTAREWGNQTGICAQDEDYWMESPIVTDTCLPAMVLNGVPIGYALKIHDCTDCECTLSTYYDASCSNILAAERFGDAVCEHGHCWTSNPSVCTKTQTCPTPYDLYSSTEAILYSSTEDILYSSTEDPFYSTQDTLYSSTEATSHSSTISTETISTSSIATSSTSSTQVTSTASTETGSYSSTKSTQHAASTLMDKTTIYVMIILIIVGILLIFILILWRKKRLKRGLTDNNYQRPLLSQNESGHTINTMGAIAVNNNDRHSDIDDIGNHHADDDGIIPSINETTFQVNTDKNNVNNPLPPRIPSVVTANNDDIELIECDMDDKDETNINYFIGERLLIEVDKLLNVEATIIDIIDNGQFIMVKYDNYNNKETEKLHVINDQHRIKQLDDNKNDNDKDDEIDQDELQMIEESIIQNEDEYNECVVCMDKLPQYACVPCGHYCVCKKCKDSINNKCPICQTKCTFIRIFK